MGYSQFDIEETFGDGNCAFNSFILGLCQKKALDQIEARFKAQKKDINQEFASFIKALNAKDWLSLRSTLLRLRYRDKLALQKRVAPWLRAQSINQARTDVDNREQFKVTVIQSAYEAFHRSQSGSNDKQDPADFYANLKSVLGDDYLHWHPALCQTLITMVLDNKTWDEVSDWWDKEGYQLFLDTMSKNGVWAGDIELKYLARYFQVNIEVVKNNHAKPYQLLDDACLKDAPVMVLHNSGSHWSNIPLDVGADTDLLDDTLNELYRVCSKHLDILLTNLIPNHKMTSADIYNRMLTYFPQYSALNDLLDVLNDTTLDDGMKIIRFHSMYQSNKSVLTNEVSEIIGDILKTIFTAGIYAMVRGVQSYRQTGYFSFWHTPITRDFARVDDRLTEVLSFTR